MNSFRSFFSKRTIVSTVSMLVMIATVWFSAYKFQSDLQIMPFNKERDTAWMLKLFYDNKYWLYEGPESEFRPEYTLEHQSSSRKAEDDHNLTIKTLYLKKTPVGFVAYHKLSFYVGKILYLVVKHEFRGQKYGYLLLQYAVDDLKRDGVKKIQLITRTTNSSSQNLYTKFGFHQIDTEDGIVTFEYDL